MKINHKLKKWITVLSISGAIIFALCDIWLRIMGANWDYRAYDTSSVLGALLGQSLYETNHPKILTPGFKDLDLMKLGKDAWNSPACSLPGIMSYYSLDGRKYSKLEFIYKRSSKTFFNAPLKECLDIDGERTVKAPKPYCNHWTRRDCINLSIHDYVLQRPDYLNKIVQILQRPCDYFPTDERLREVGLFGVHDAWAIRDAREVLGCSEKNKQPKRYILTIMDQRLNPRFDIVIHRQD